MSDGIDGNAKKKERILSRLADFPVHKRAYKGITSRTTYYRWRDEDPEFDQAVLVSLNIGDELLEDELVERAIEGKDTTALIFALKTRKRDRYGDKQHVEHSGAITFADLAGIATADAESSSIDPRPGR